MECGKMVFFPSVDSETREVICTHCRKPALEEIPRAEMAAQGATA